MWVSFRERSAKARAKTQASIAREVLSERYASQCNLVLNSCGLPAGAAEVHFVY